MTGPRGQSKDYNNQAWGWFSAHHAAVRTWCGPLHPHKELDAVLPVRDPSAGEAETGGCLNLLVSLSY